MRIAVFFVGNRLMLDDGIGPAVYDYIVENYNFGNEMPANEVLANVHPSSERVATSKATTSSMVQSTVDMFDVGCMTLDMVSKVNEYDLLITVDAVDGTDAEPGTVFRYEPYDIARAAGARTSLHELKLADLFDAATMLGFEAEGLCFGMQVENLEPVEFVEGLTPKVKERMPFLAETVIAELSRRGCSITRKDGKPLNQLG
ncbi:MAG TPA: hydrogenase maturation protease [Eggerthellaceae bacterium]|nr:hydrogenase maturation protease [Eggerthellaceae bacterium]